ncbi:uncharacterized protein LOC143286592 [Babylonia areolata]|uniref:uncharacterized protein LOC143286592 n=1 Tax=Babylonia areolata TaxID=304850 RepID=UPI003FD459CE
MNTSDNSTTMMELSPFRGEPINDVARVFFITLGSLMIICGVTGNAFLISVIIQRFRRRRYVHNLFIGNLALADILTLGYWLTFFVLDLILGYNPVVNQTHCEVNGMMVGVLSVVSTLSLVSISVNRYLHVCHCHLYHRVFTLRRTVLLCLLTWVLGVLLTWPPLLGVRGAGSYHYNTLTHICSFNRDRLTYSKVVVLLFATLPMLLIGYCNFAIFRFWRRARLSLSVRFPAPAPASNVREDGKGEKPGVKFGRRMQAENGRCGENLETVSEEMCERSERYKKEENISESNEEEQEEEEETGKESSVHRFSRSEDAAETPGSAMDDSEQSGEEDTRIGETNEKGSGRAELPCRLQIIEEERTNVTTTTTTTTTEDKPKHVQLCPESAPSAMTHNVSKQCPKTSRQTSVPGVDQSSTQDVGPTAAAAGSLSLSTSFLKPSCCRRKKETKKNKFATALQTLQQQRRKKRAREVAFVRSLLVVFILMFLCFIPYGVSIVVSSFLHVPAEVLILGVMFLFANNSINWIVYGVMNSAFRHGYAVCARKLLAVCCRVGQGSLPRFLVAAASSQNSQVMTTTMHRFNTDNELEQSCVSQTASGVL